MKSHTFAFVLFVLTTALSSQLGAEPPAGTKQGRGELTEQAREQSGEQGREQSGEQGQRRPPKEAIEACSGKASGTSCSFSGKNSENVQGTCWSPDSDKPLACKPARH